MAGDTKQDLFFVRRNTNRNEVHYQIGIAGDTSTPVGANPISGYWQMHEKGPGVTEPITVFEQMAFGVGPQRVEGNRVFFHLTGMPDREIRVEHTGNPERPYAAHISINGADAELKDFYVFAEAAFLMPKVKYFEIHGLRNGEAVRCV